MRVLIIPDKFKGSLTAGEAARAMARGWRKARPKDRLDLLPMSDGGDGFGKILGGLLGARTRSLTTLDAAHRPLRAPWWWRDKTRTAIIESAGIVGLAMLSGKKFHPFQLDTFGLGKALQSVGKAGAGNCLVGIGGSATNDGGFGLARALGWRFFGHYGEELEEWWQMAEMEDISPPPAPLPMRVSVAADVRNPLLGPAGCSRTYGPQKGLRPEDLGLTEKCLGRLAWVLQERCGMDAANVPGAGAAGGLGFGLMAFAGAKIEFGFGLFARHAQLKSRIRAADVVLTGEGALDAQTQMGKGVGQIAQGCARGGVPCWGLAGMVDETVRRSGLFARTGALVEITSASRARSHAAHHLAQLAELAGRGWASSLKQDNGDSFTKVLRRRVHKPAETAGELLDAYEDEPPPKVEPLPLTRLLNQRGRRSGGRQ
jgi:glycerate kinase